MDRDSANYCFDGFHLTLVIDDDAGTANCFGNFQISNNDDSCCPKRSLFVHFTTVFICSFSSCERHSFVFCFYSFPRTGPVSVALGLVADGRTERLRSFAPAPTSANV